MAIRTPVRVPLPRLQLVTCPRIRSSCAARASTTSRISMSAFPRDKLVVITGLSGSGKSSLAFDTIYAEGQRRYVESLSAYARQFLGQMEKPDVDHIDGLRRRSRSTRRAPAGTLARPSARSPRSTTTCACSTPASASRTARTAARSAPDVQQIVDGAGDARGHPAPRPGAAHQGPQGRGRPGLRGGAQAGLRARAGRRRAVDLGEASTLDKYKQHTIEVVVDRSSSARRGWGLTAELWATRRTRSARRSRNRRSRSRTRIGRGWLTRSRRRCGSARASS